MCDLDGTLVDIRRRDHSAYVAALGAVGEASLDVEEFWAARRSGRRVVDLLPETTDDAAREVVLQTFVDVVERDSSLDLDVMFPESERFLRGCASRGWRTSVCTLRRRPEGVRRQIRRLGLGDLVDEVCVVAHSPDAPKAAFLRGIGGPVVMVGDTEADITSARAAGAVAFAVTTGLRDRAFLERFGPDLIADSLLELLPALEAAVVARPGGHAG